MSTYRIACLGQILTFALMITACGGSGGSDDSDSSTDVADTTDTATTSGSGQGLDTNLFVSGALVQSITTESCVLSGGTTTSCYRIEIAGTPADEAIGPFCPRTIFAEADEVGIWFDGSGDTYDLDGAFITNLANFYGDGNWLLYDVSSGDVNVTETLEACELAARPNVDVAYQNYCVECDIGEVGAQTAVVLIPVDPVALSSADSISNQDIGVTLNGVIIAPAAPVQAILGAYTIAAFDDCGGHVNPNAGYHYHAANGCSDSGTQADGHAPIMGYMIDGYALHTMLNEDGTEPDDLDECRGHTDTTRGYHYHAASAGENMFIGCFHGEQGSFE